MNIIEALRIALNSLATNRLRSLLATLGIAIGIAAVSTLLSIGQSFLRFVEEQFAAFNTDALILQAQPDFSGSGIPAEQGRLTDEDLRAIGELPNVREVVGVYANYGGEIMAADIAMYPEILGVRPNYLTNGTGIALGRFIDEADVAGRRRVAVLDWNLAQNLFPDGRPLGREIQVMGLSFTVVGVLERPEGIIRGQQLLVPLSTARDRLFPETMLSGIEVNQATIYLNDPAQVASSEAQVRQLLRQRHKLTAEQANDFSFANMQDEISAVTNVLLGITAFLGVIGGISLLVGGIGITNIMLVSVAERTREIGLRKAVGARRYDILLQFLVEAITLSLIGGIGGVLFTSLMVNAGAIAIHIAGQPDLATFLAIDFQAVLLALLFASAIGMIAGIYPAFRASRLAPIEALRVN